MSGSSARRVVADVGRRWGTSIGPTSTNSVPAFYARPRVGALGSHPCQEHFVYQESVPENRRPVLACREDRSAYVLTTGATRKEYL
jgi:hypothetical protein